MKTIVAVPAYKNQHFLPAVYLQEFSADKSRNDRKSRVWRFDGKRSHSVVVESQCAKDYFYSKDHAVIVESMFGEMESFYGGCVQKVKQGKQPKKDEFFGLILMMFDLKLRNAAQRNETAHDNYQAYRMRLHLFKRSILLGWNERDPSDAEVVEHLTRNWRLKILTAETGTEFLTSDNPAIWLASPGPKPKLEMVILPLTPDHVAVAYDKRLVQVTGSATTAHDQFGMIQLQCRSSVHSVYSSEQLMEDEEKLVSQLLKTERSNPGTITEEGWKADMIRLGAGVKFSFTR